MLSVTKRNVQKCIPGVIRTESKTIILIRNNVNVFDTILKVKR